MKFLVTLLLLFSSVHAKEVSIFLIRHGETDWNVGKRVQGHTDIPLNATGIAQADATAETLLCLHPDISAIYSSDLSRAFYTAKAFADKTDLPIVIRSALREVNNGVAEGMPTEEKIAIYKEAWEALEKKYPQRKELWSYSPIPGEETINQLIQRIKVELTSIAVEATDNQKIAVFTHGKAMKVFIADIEDQPLEQIHIPNCAIFEIRYNSGHPTQPFKTILNVLHNSFPCPCPCPCPCPKTKKSFSQLYF